MYDDDTGFTTLNTLNTLRTEAATETRGSGVVHLIVELTKVCPGERSCGPARGMKLGRRPAAAAAIVGHAAALLMTLGLRVLSGDDDCQSHHPL